MCISSWAKTEPKNRKLVMTPAAILRALGFDPDLEELHRVYATIVKEMIITRGLKHD